MTMKNREFQTLIAGVLLAALMAGSLAPASLYAKEGEKEESIQYDRAGSGQTVSSQTQEDAGTEKAVPVKEETVYAKVDGQGAVKSVIVSDQLRNVSGKTEIEDMSDLTDIENVKGDETFTADGKMITWNGSGEDIVYQGTTEKSLPVGVEVSYELDGKTVSAEELAGKSGHLVIHYSYKNTSRQDSGEYVPFLMVTGMAFDAETFANVTVQNGKLLSDGTRDMAVGIGLPELGEELGTDDIDIPDYFEVEADVTDYQSPEVITIALNDVFCEENMGALTSVEDLNNSLSVLDSAAAQLVSGSGELKTGLDTLLASSGTLVDGVQALVNGGDTLAAGTGALESGAWQVSDGLVSASGQVASVLAPGVESLNTGVGQMEEALGAKLPELSQGVDALYNGINAAAAGAKTLDESLDTAATGAGALSQGVSALADNSGSLSAGAQSVYDYLCALPYTTGASGAAADTTSSQDEISSLQGLIDSGAVTGDTAAALESVIASLGADQGIRDSLNAAPTAGITVDPEVLAAAEAVKDGVYQMNQALVGEAGLAAGAQGLSYVLSEEGGIGYGVSQLSAALNEGDAQTGIPGIASGIASLEAAVNGEDGLTGQVSSGLSQLKSGTESLVQGVNGENGLSEGLSQLSAGAGQVAAGAKEVSNGAFTLSQGLGTLQSGSAALADGVTLLDEGASELSSGMTDFYEEGISKLADAFEGNIGELLDKLNDMQGAAENYKNFSGISGQMDGTVRFIFISE